MLKKEIYAIHRRVRRMFDFTKLGQRTAEIRQYGSFIADTYDLLLERFAEMYVDEFIRGSKPEKSLSPAKRLNLYFEKILKSKELNKRLRFHAGIALLNRIDWEPEAALKQLSAAYEEFVQSHLERSVILWAAAFPFVAKYLLPLVARVRHAFRLRFGSRLRVVLGVIGLLSELERSFIRSHSTNWQSMFGFVIEELKHPEVFQTFVFWKFFFNANAQIRPLLKEANCEQLDELFSGFCTLLHGQGLLTSFQTYSPR
jgi:hypothetical protein